MQKLKVVTVVGTRPEIIRLSRVIAKLDIFCEHILVHSGQNYDYELNGIFFDDLGIRQPDHFLEAAGSTSAQTMANVVSAFDALLDKLEPDAVLVLGDTNSCLSVIPAKRRKIPTFHMEAGNRCFDDRVPEEINRRIVDHTSDINLTYSRIAREYLLAEGFPPDRIINTGSPMREVLDFYQAKIESAEVLQCLGITRGQYFVVSAHREENIDSDKNFAGLVELLNAIAFKYQLPVIVSTHPRARKRIEAMQVVLDDRVRLLKPLAFTDYVRLQRDARATLSDSGTISEESAIIGFPALNLRETHERPEAMEEAAVMMVGISLDRVIQGLEILASQADRTVSSPVRVVDYEAENVSEKVLKIILSYVDYVNRVVWKKY